MNTSTTIRRTLLIAAFICVVNIQQTLSVSEEFQELINMLHRDCQAETGVQEQLIVDARSGNFAEDNSLKCYMKCILDQMAVIQDDGTLDLEGMIAMLPPEKKELGEKMIRSCGTKSGVDVCDMVFQTNKCYYETSPKDYFLP